MNKIIIALLVFMTNLNINAQITTYEDFIKASEDILIYKNEKKSEFDYENNEDVETDYENNDKKEIDYKKTAQALADLYPLDKHNAISRSIIYNIPGKKANEIYVEVNNWFVHSFKSGKSVIQLNDKEEGIIIGKGYINALGSNMGFSNTSSAAAWIILRVDIKDEKMRVIATIQSYEVTKSTGIGLALLGAPVRNYGVVEYIPVECFPYTKKEKGTGSKALTLAHCWIVTSVKQLNDAVSQGITGFETDDF